jgi:hypothetical protein
LRLDPCGGQQGAGDNEQRDGQVKGAVHDSRHLENAQVQIHQTGSPVQSAMCVEGLSVSKR